MRTDKSSAAGVRRKGRKETSPQDVHSHEDTSTRIVSAATRLFAQNGYDGTSTKEICESAAANIAAIHYHFGSKENLYRHIIEQFATERFETARKTLETPRNLDDMKVRLEIFLRETLDAVIRQKDVIHLILREIEMGSRFDEIFRSNYRRPFEAVVEFLALAKRKNLLASDVDPFFAAEFLISQIRHLPMVDTLKKKHYGYSIEDEKYRRQWIEQTIRIFMGGVAGLSTRLDHNERNSS